MTALPVLNTGMSSRGWGRISTFLECPRKYAYKQVTTKDKSSAAPLVRGTIIHLGLANHYLGRDDPEQAMFEEAQKYGEEGAKQYPIALKVFHAYQQRYLKETFEVISVETEYKTTFSGFTYTARFDLVVRDYRGRVWVYDHKTTSKLKADSAQRYSESGQFLGAYHIARQEWGGDFNGVIINVLGMFPPQFTREILIVSEEEVAAFPAKIIKAEQEIETLTGLDKKAGGLDNATVWPLNLSSCKTVYGMCEFNEQCLKERT